jgi:hypothetical protein
MAISTIESVKVIEQQFNTGEEPVLVTCSDMNTYICKYMRSSAAAYKLACELIGSQMAASWQIDSPDYAFVHIHQRHWNGRQLSHNLYAPAIGSKRINGVVDVTPSTFREVNQSVIQLQQLMKIALFDFWIANEDRNANNANLLYNVIQEKIVSIDYGCILNTATYDFPLSQLTTTDTILCSDLFHHLSKEKGQTTIDPITTELKTDYCTCLKRSLLQVDEILTALPKEWNVSIEIVREKLKQLFEEQWISETWNNFMDCLNENLSHE